MSAPVVIGNATLYLGDSVEILPTLGKVDAVVTDPPYGLGDKWQGGGGSARTSWKFDPSEARGWDQNTADGVLALTSLAPEVIVWGGNYYPLPPSRCWLLWDKKQNDQWTTGQAEMAWTNLDRPVRVFRFAQCEQASEGKKFHPTQKPLALMAWCLKWIVGETVVDPFMGSGTTGVAATQLGRKFVGIEREPRYFDIACKRIEQAYSQRPLFDAEPQKQAEQLGLEAAGKPSVYCYDCAAYVVERCRPGCLLGDEDIEPTATPSASRSADTEGRGKIELNPSL